MNEDLDNRLKWNYFLFFWIKKKIKNLLNTNIKTKRLNTLDKSVINLKNNFIENKVKKKFILFLCLESFELFFFIIWSVVTIKMGKHDYGIKVISSKKNLLINKLSIMFNYELIILEDVKKNKKIDAKLLKRINMLNSSNDFYKFKYHGFDLGCMIISNFCRIHRVGFVNFNSYLQKKIIKNTLINFIEEYDSLFNQEFLKNIHKIYTFEKNLFPYLHFFLFSLKKKIDLIHWSGSNLDEKTFIVKRYSKKNIYSHHSSISSKLWNKIKNNYSNNIAVRNKIIFKKRFSGNFAPFSVNLIECGKNFNLKIKKINKKKNCIIFSHILHDTLYFFGKEYYDSYAHWLISTVKIACKNTNVNWHIKIHPSNIYRGEFKKGFSKEEDIIRQELKYIPPHIKFIYPDTKINPLAWMKFADIGVTIRGTAGLEMAVLGKKVITCGKNRYENKGFTIDPKSKGDYEKILLNLPNIKKTSKRSFQKANLFYNYVFEKKGFRCNFININMKNKIFNWNSINFKLVENKILKNINLDNFKNFLLSKKKVEYIVHKT